MNQDAAVKPLGKIRNPLAPLGLSIITLGVYIFVWLYKILEEMRHHSGDYKITSGGIAVGFLFIPLFGFFWLIYLWFRIPTCVNMMKSACGSEKIELNPIMGLLNLIPFVGWVIWTVMIQSSLNDHWKSHEAKAQ